MVHGSQLNSLRMSVLSFAGLCTMLVYSCGGGSNSAAAQEMTSDEQYITSADIAGISDDSDSTARCLSENEFRGMKLFMKNCNGCHPAGTAAKGPSLIDKALPDFLIHFQVRQGLGDMPSFTKDQISRDEVKMIILFIRELREDYLLEVQSQKGKQNPDSAAKKKIE